MILLDTCTLLWLATEPTRLSAAARESIRENAGVTFVSAIAAWEIALKQSTGRLTLPKPPADWYTETLAHHGLRELPVTGVIGLISGTLPLIHRDPADRFTVATALHAQLPIVTPDSHIRQYAGVTVIW